MGLHRHLQEVDSSTDQFISERGLETIQEGEIQSTEHAQRERMRMTQELNSLLRREQLRVKQSRRHIYHILREKRDQHSKITHKSTTCSCKKTPAGDGFDVQRNPTHTQDRPLRQSMQNSSGASQELRKLRVEAKAVEISQADTFTSSPPKLKETAIPTWQHEHFSLWAKR